MRLWCCLLHLYRTPVLLFLLSVSAVIISLLISDTWLPLQTHWLSQHDWTLSHSASYLYSILSILHICSDDDFPCRYFNFFLSLWLPSTMANENFQLFSELLISLSLLTQCKDREVLVFTSYPTNLNIHMTSPLLLHSKRTLLSAGPRFVLSSHVIKGYALPLSLLTKDQYNVQIRQWFSTPHWPPLLACNVLS